LSEVLHRLLDNALKFRLPDGVPRVEVGAHTSQGMWVFSVRDNGIGIDPAYHTKIFDVFQRLNRREAYEGNGMGLAVCRRIVEAYGGKLWVESTEGSGATFRFTAPMSA
jgi:light-regulated signal transduction histidine kinase (bacteriophytochrome)